VDSEEDELETAHVPKNIPHPRPLPPSVDHPATTMNPAAVVLANATDL
jgi:hypothetical protein